MLYRSQILIFIFVIIAFHGCIMSKKSTDRAVIDHLYKNPTLVRECAEFAVGFSIGHKIKEFQPAVIEDKYFRSKLLSLGSTVYINYKANPYSTELPDSNVTFKTITLFGVTEVVYDFAQAERTFTDDVTNRKNYYFKKVAERVYYRRRQLPMM